MNTTVHSTLDGLKLGQVQTYRGLSIFPIISQGKEGPDYLTLEEAIGQDLLSITEIDESGSVPELRVVSKSDKPVLLLDGEELQGAKQNRVLNTTVLLAPKSTTVIPVSCTEQGRWSYDSPKFTSSHIVMDHQVRQKKMASVSHSRRHHDSYNSDQSEVWEGIGRFQRRANVDSPTAAMKDVFTAKEKDYDECLKAFPLVDNQVGLVAFIDGKPAGSDVLSSPRAFASLHNKLIKSYASDAIMSVKTNKVIVTEKDVHEFISGIIESGETRHSSVSLGEDFRYSSSFICGSALVYENNCIHGAFFASQVKQRDTGTLSSYQMRRGFRGSDNN